MNPEDIQSLVDSIGSDTPASTEDLTTARAELVDTLREGHAAGDLDLAEARALRDTINALDAELAIRAETAETEAAEMAALLDGLDTETEDEPEAVAEATEPTPEAAAEVVAEAEAITEAAPEPVAAAAPRVPTQALRRRRAGQSDQPETPAKPGVVVAAVGHASTFGGRIETVQDAAAVFAQFAGDQRRKTPLVRLEWEHERMLGSNPDANSALVASTLTPEAIVAGICGPTPALYDQPVCGERGRPIRDALPSFGATRGGVRFAPTIGFGELASAVALWTHETDADPGSATKPCPRIDCEAEVEAFVDAVTACLTVSNFTAIFNPEQWRAALDALFIQHDHEAELNLWNQMAAAAVDANAVDYGSTARNVLINTGKAAAAVRNRNRVNPNAQVTAIMPAWLRDAIRDSLTFQQPGDQVVSVTNATVDGYFSAKNITPVWSPDIDMFAAQSNNSPLTDYPATTHALVFTSDTYQFLDGGRLDLGTDITDSELNSTNDRQAFMETFEGVTMRGCGPILVDEIPVDEDCICPAGS